MMTIAEALASEGVALHPQARDHTEAVQQIAGLLQRDARVLNWPLLHAELAKSVTCLVEPETEFGICFPHARLDTVTDMVMSAGRFDPGVLFPDCARPVRYVFCIAVPTGLASDYLRIVGLLMRMLRSPQIEGELRGVATPAEFIAALSRLEAAL